MSERRKPNEIDLKNGNNLESIINKIEERFKKNGSIIELVIKDEDLTHTDLRDRFLMGINFEGTDFTNSDLSEADLSGAHMKECIFDLPPILGPLVMLHIGCLYSTKYLAFC